MWSELKRHEQFVRELLAHPGAVDGLAAVREHHDRRVRDFQHERMVHLIVTLFVALFAFLTLGWALAHPSPAAWALGALLLALTAGYLLHYYRLENGVQRLYELSRQLDERLAGRPLAHPPAKEARADRGA